MGRKDRGGGRGRGAGPGAPTVAAYSYSTTTASPCLTTADGLDLHARLWTGARSRGLLVVSHGLGEHAGAYAELAGRLTTVPGLVDVLAFDYRGHGRSPGKRGVVRRYEDMLLDLRAALAWAGREHGGRPRFLLGHSNGGQLALRAVLADPGGLDGLILSNPSLRVAADIPPWKLLAARFLKLAAPRVTLDSGLDDSWMTRDESLYPARQSDCLRHRRVCAPLFFGMVAGGRLVLERADQVRVPTLELLGEDDHVVDPRAGRALFERLGSPDKTLLSYPGMRHEPINEIGREAVIAEVIGWLRERLDRSGSP